LSRVWKKFLVRGAKFIIKNGRLQDVAAIEIDANESGKITSLREPSSVRPEVGQLLPEEGAKA
jgi:hypothetical protein